MMPPTEARSSNGAIDALPPHIAAELLPILREALSDIARHANRLDVESSAHLAAQLPMLVRGLYYEVWDPTGKPERMSHEELVAQIEQDALVKGKSEAEDAARAVIALLWNQLGEGTMSKVISILPGDYTRLL